MKKKQIEAHGKVEGGTLTTLEQVWGFNELAKYGTNKYSEYESQINEMNRPELETHARRVGVVIVQDSFRLKASLLSEFNKYITFLSGPPKNNVPANTKVSDVAKRILAEGR